MYTILTTHEMRTKPENVSKNEASFKSTRKPKNSKNEYKNISKMYDEEEDNLMGNLKQWQQKYKGKLPFKFFKCCRVGHFASKCTYEIKIKWNWGKSRLLKTKGWLL